MKKTHLLLFVIMLMMVLILSGCGHATVKKDAEIINDLSSTEIFTEEFPEFTIKDIEIVKRQTDVENKSDKVYVTLSVINDDESISGYMNMAILYGLYNDGWILDECDIDFDGANKGYYFWPEKALEISLDEISSELVVLTGDTFSDVAIYNVESDLENGTVAYSVTGTDHHAYMTGEIDATLTYNFHNNFDCWQPPTLTVNSYDEHWNIAGRFIETKNATWCFELVIADTIDTFSIKDSYYNETVSGSDISIYKISDTTLKQAMGDFLYRGKDITKQNYSIELTEECTNFYSFEYVAKWGDRIFFIGKDQLGYMWNDDYDVDEYHHKVLCNVYELLPVE